MLVNSTEFIQSARPLGFNKEVFNEGLDEMLKAYKSSDLTEELYSSVFFIIDHAENEVKIWTLDETKLNNLTLSENHSIVPVSQLMTHFIH